MQETEFIIRFFNTATNGSIYMYTFFSNQGFQQDITVYMCYCVK